MDALLGLDIGTTHCKAVLLSIDGVELGRTQVVTPWSPVPTGATVQAEALFEAAVQAIGATLSAAPTHQLLGLGICSLAETGVLLGERDRPIAPAIAWFDRRGTPEVDSLTEALGADEFMRRTGLPVGPVPSLVKYRWLRRNFGGLPIGKRWLSVAEWIARRLGGSEVAEFSLASRTGFLDVWTRSWWSDAAAWAEAPPHLLPPLVQAGTPIGRVSSDAVPAAVGAVLTIAGHDHVCAAVGAGTLRPGEVLNSCGSAEAVLSAVRPLVPDEIEEAVIDGLTVGCHVVPGMQVIMGGFHAAAVADRALALLGIDRTDRLDVEAASILSGEWLPRIAGRANNALEIDAGGGPTTPARAWAATLISSAKATRATVATLERHAGLTSRFVVTGGGARSAAARAAKHVVFGEYVDLADLEAGCRGAALLAGRAVGVYPSLFELPRIAAVPQVTLQPSVSRRSRPTRSQP